MFSSIQSIPGLIFAKSDVKAKIRPGVEARVNSAGESPISSLRALEDLLISSDPPKKEQTLLITSREWSGVRYKVENVEHELAS